jgi:hypothetical protein
MIEIPNSILSSEVVRKVDEDLNRLKDQILEESKKLEAVVELKNRNEFLTLGIDESKNKMYGLLYEKYAESIQGGVDAFLTHLEEEIKGFSKK